MEWNEPLFATGPGDTGRVGVLVLHGFGGSPRSLQELALRLVDSGYTVALPLLAGHGLTPEAMEKSRWMEWTADAGRPSSGCRSGQTRSSCSGSLWAARWPFGWPSVTRR